MSEKQNVEEILRRLDEVLPVLKSVLTDLQEISKSLRSISPAPTPSAPAPEPSPAREAPKIPTPTPAGRRRGIQDVRMMFPQELEDLLTFTEKDDYIMIKPRQYLGSENFAKIASIIRGAGGQYISAGKDSHFRVPKQFE
ncbi:MAG TPA: hypothetical protein VMS95_06450 [Candidatus Krumholzibacteriaceae bacterium]|jgi:hypothetical protein|nr:hypothetical protein [Candidatus Krumholzibacteriaceae bacterium]